MVVSAGLAIWSRTGRGGLRDAVLSPPQPASATARVAPAAPSTGVSRETMPARLPPRPRHPERPTSPAPARFPCRDGIATRMEADLTLTTRIAATIVALALSA